MKNLSRFRFALFASALLILGSCSKSSYTFAPNTGGYHGAQKTAVAVQENKEADAATEAVASHAESKPAVIAAPQAETSAALAKAFTNPQNTQKAASADKKISKETFKQLKKDLKQQLKKKDINDGQKVQIDQTVKLLIILGLIFLLLGLISKILGTIGIILIVIGLVLLLLNTL